MKKDWLKEMEKQHEEMVGWVTEIVDYFERLVQGSPKEKNPVLYKNLKRRAKYMMTSLEKHRLLLNNARKFEEEISKN